MRILWGSPAVLVLLAVGACTTFGAPPEDGGASQDGGTSGEGGDVEGGPTDATFDGPLPPGERCAKGAPFTKPPTPITVQGVMGVESIRFAPDLGIGFIGGVLPTESKNVTRLFTVTRAGSVYNVSGTLTFDDPVSYDAFVAPLPSTGNPSFIFASSRGGALRAHVAIQTGPGIYNVPAQGVPSGLSLLSEPYVLPARKAVYFSASPGTADWDIYRADISSGVDLKTGRLLTNVPTNAGEFAPVVTDDEQEIFFATDRDNPGTGKLETWRADKDGTDAWKFQVGAAMSELKGAGNVVYPTFISRDACDLYVIVKTAQDDPGGKVMVIKRR